ncbi:pentapeptide repeat-containing protein [Hymenobacter convexus]|uniref:pentapeptide repeat-containing protein n=1 Tax=Hymenobacter sp. CA1UV-4 TaxID=3063782 RepID=UPI0027142BC3|nr:pentapeptide repeat-containing protein [Hymenobacter sp. CA1UV-4]MDO7851646.1 pentapeptide repeat-containing protein [Hymenobacter sp. CA1UV-4]
MKLFKRDGQKGSLPVHDSAYSAHGIILNYLRKLWRGDAIDSFFESKSLNNDLNFNSLNLAELIFAVIKERNLSKERVQDFLRIGITGGGDSDLANLIERIDILSLGGFEEPERIMLLNSGTVGGRLEIKPINNKFDTVGFVIKMVRALESTKELEGHDAVDVEFDIVDGVQIKLAKKNWGIVDDSIKETHLAILLNGVDKWNEWRENNPTTLVDLRGISLFERGISFAGVNLKYANLEGALLAKVDFRGADFSACYLKDVNLEGADLRGANFSGAYGSQAKLSIADMRKCDLRLSKFDSASFFYTDLGGSNLSKAKFSFSFLNEAHLNNVNAKLSSFDECNLKNADFSGAILNQSDFSGAILVNTNFSLSDISNCNVFGASVWRVNLDGTIQNDLIITGEESMKLTVDNLNLAQFIYLMLDNSELRTIIDSITSKIILILGRFTEERKIILSQIKKELSIKNYLPIIFDFESPNNRDLLETVATIAHLSQFIIADLTDPRSIPQELMSIVPGLPSVPVQPIILKGQKPWALFSSLRRYPWVLDVFEYNDVNDLVNSIDMKVILPVHKYLNTK